MTDKPEVTVTEADEAKARALIKPYMERRWSGFELADAIALALAETRERAEARLWLEFDTTEREYFAAAGKAEECIAELEAENARLRASLQEYTKDTAFEATS